MKNLIDPGHGRNTPGKCSPDGRFREYQYTREIAAAVVARLQALGHDAEVLVPEFEDIPLSERVRRVNTWCRRLGKDNVILVSVHVDAAGSDGQLHNATGWSCYTSPGLPLPRCRKASPGAQDSDGLFRWRCGQGGPLRLTDAHPLRSCAHGKRVPGFQREPGLPGVSCGKEGYYWVACGGDNRVLAAKRSVIFAKIPSVYTLQVAYTIAAFALNHEDGVLFYKSHTFTRE